MPRYKDDSSTNTIQQDVNIHPDTAIATSVVIKTVLRLTFNASKYLSET
jgi:hypothetical protein